MNLPGKALEVDFAALAVADADFGKIYAENDGFVNFQDPSTVRQLTTSILKRYFKLRIDLPSDRLCPPVPVRYEYIRWLQDLVDTTSEDFTDDHDPSRVVVGIDIGVGASCIYPLLGCASRPQWRFGGTDIDDKSLACAKQNVELNDLQSRIRLCKANPAGPILDLAALRLENADFTMCNPPFFTSRQDMLATHLRKKRSPSAVCSGAEVEMVTDGGDLGFVSKMIDESVKLGEQVQWYSSMLGKLASVHAVVAKLKEAKISNWAVTTLQAGNVTKRWAVAWSFGDLRPRMDVARGVLHTKDILPFPAEHRIPVAVDGFAAARTLMQRALEELDLRWEWDGTRGSGLAFAKENVWSRSARRKKRRDTPSAAGMEEVQGSDEDVVLGVRITALSSSAAIEIRWLQGVDSVLFESFCGMLKRAINRS